MLVAEIVSTRTIPPGGELKPLSFGDEMWEGNEEGKEVARRVRSVLKEASGAGKEAVEGWQDVLRSRWADSNSNRTIPALRRPPPTPSTSPPALAAAQPPTRPLISIIDDPDDLRPYPLPDPPSESVLSALASDDASLYSTALPTTSTSTTRKRGKLRAPVYIPELVAYLKGQEPEGKKEEADGEAERMEVGLKEGEGLIRRKRGWGGELGELARGGFDIGSSADTLSIWMQRRMLSIWLLR
jgi:telomere length regulation protein